MKIYAIKRFISRLGGVKVPFRFLKRKEALFCALFLALLLLSPAISKAYSTTTFYSADDYNNIASNSSYLSQTNSTAWFSYNQYGSPFDGIGIWGTTTIHAIHYRIKNDSGHDTIMFAGINTYSPFYPCDSISIKNGYDGDVSFNCHDQQIFGSATGTYQYGFNLYIVSDQPIRIYGNNSLYNGIDGWNVNKNEDRDPVVAMAYSHFDYTQFDSNGVIWLPHYPPDCNYTIVATDTLASFNATGTVMISSDNPALWDFINIQFQEMNTGTTTYFGTTTSLVAGDIYDYSIPVSLPSGAWKLIQYILSGVSSSTLYHDTYSCSQTTGIGTGLPLPTWTEITQIEFASSTDCSTLSPFSVEKYVCEVENLLIHIFVPSNQSVQNLKNTVDGLSNKAPMNYISATSDLFKAMNEGALETAVNYKILGNNATVSFAMFDKPTTIAGQTDTIGNTFKTFFIFLLICVFLIWAISFVRKVFR